MDGVYAFLADGLEEVECLAAMDVLKRGGVKVTLVSVNGTCTVIGSHGFSIGTDREFSQIDPSQADVLFLPGGMPGTTNLENHEGLSAALKDAAAKNRRIAAICAAPSVLGKLGILDGKKATCYPGFEEYLHGALHVEDGVVTDGNVTTARGLGYALDLGLELLRLLKGETVSNQVKEAIQYERKK